MKIKYKQTKLKPGVTLIELTVVIVVILSLISVLFIGAQAYRNGASRSACLIKQRAIHQAVLSHMNMNQGNFSGDPDEDAVAGSTVNNDNTLGATYADQLVGEGLFFPEAPTCPRSNEDYDLSAGTYPQVGDSALECPTFSTADNGNHIFRP